MSTEVARPHVLRARGSIDTLVLQGAICMGAGALFLTIPLYFALSGPMPLPRAVIASAILGGFAGCALIGMSNLLVALKLCLLMFFAIPFYQLALLDSFPETVFLRVLPFILILPLMIAPLGDLLKREPAFPLYLFLWFMAHLYCLFTGIDLYENRGLIFIAVILPPLLYIGFNYLFIRTQDELQLHRLIFLGILITILCSLASLPLEQAYKETRSTYNARNLSSMNQVIGYVLLLWPFIYKSLRSVRLPLKLVFWGLLVTALVLSYSRGGVVCFTLLVFLTFFKVKPSRVVGILALFAGAYYYLNQYPDSRLAYYWGLRFNVSALGSGDEFGRNLGLLFETTRFEIWQISLEAAIHSNFLGMGLGEFSNLMMEASNGMWAFGGSHSMLLTALVERGFAATLFILLLLLSISVSFSQMRLKRSAHFEPDTGKIALGSFLIFLLYAHSVGVELVQYSSRIMHVHPSFFLLICLCYGRAYHYKRRQVTSMQSAPSPPFPQQSPRGTLATP